MREATRVSALYFFFFTFLGIYAPFASPYYASLGLSGPEMGIIGAVLPIAAAFIPPLWGAIADRLGQTTRPLQVALWGACVMLLPFPFARTFAPLFAVLVGYGLFRNGIVPLLDSLTLTLTERIGGEYGRIRSWGSIGFLVASVAVAFAADAGWQGAVVWGMVGTQLVAALASVGLPRAPRDRASNLIADLRELLTRPLFIRLLVVSALVQVGSFGPLFFYPTHMRELGLSNVLLGAFWWTGVLAEVVLFRVAPRVIARIGLGALFVLSPLTTATRWAVPLVTDLPWVVIAAQSLHALSFGGLYYAAVTWLAQAVPLRLRASGQSLYAAVAFGIGGGFSTLVSGWIVESWHIEGVLWLGVAASLAALALCRPVVAVMQRSGVEVAGHRS
ncbi:MAG: hypothetical protein AMXMBFR64_55860 [Myxococcales bacterium]